MQIVLIGNRVVAHGEDCFLCMGGTVICEETGKAYPNATVAEVDAIPVDIGKVGYEYHAGVFVPCAPFGVGDGNLAVVCGEDCKVIKDSGKPVGDVLDHLNNQSNPHGVTKEQVGLSNVPNVSTNNQTPTYTAASTLAALKSGEKLSTAFGKIAKAVSSFMSHASRHASGGADPITPADIGAFGFKRQLTAADDLNTLKEFGLYFFYTGDVPKNSPYQNASYVEVLGLGTAICIQRVTRYGAAGHCSTRAIAGEGDDLILPWMEDFTIVDASTEGYDMDAILTSGAHYGAYVFGADTLGTPYAKGVTGWGYGLILSYASSVTNGSQFAIMNGDPKPYFRRAQNGVISDWVGIATTDYALARDGSNSMYGGLNIEKNRPAISLISTVNGRDLYIDHSDTDNIVVLSNRVHNDQTNRVSLFVRDESVALANILQVKRMVNNEGSTYDVLHTGNLSALGVARVVTGSYVGTGAYGEDNPCSLTFDFVPKFIMISPKVTSVTSGDGHYITRFGLFLPVAGVGITCSTNIGNPSTTMVEVTLSGTTVSWYKYSGAEQLNQSTEYEYVAIG